MKKFLHITEYSSLKPYSLPVKSSNEFDLTIDNSIIRTYVDSNKNRIKENFDIIYDSSKLEEKTIPLDQVIIYDNLDLVNDNQQIAYIYECPICFNKTITTDFNLEVCPHCENPKFSPEVIGLMNTKQKENIAIYDDDVSTLIQVKDNKVVFKDLPKEVKDDTI